MVDDDDSVRQSLEPLLRTEGWRTEGFACAEEYLAHPRARGASCLVTEVVLPDIAASIGLVVGSEYPLDFFQAERHVVQSNLRIDTTIDLVPDTVH